MVFFEPAICVVLRRVHEIKINMFAEQHRSLALTCGRTCTFVLRI